MTLDPTTTYQTIRAWEVTAWAGPEGVPTFDRYKDQMYDLAVGDLGINRLRLEVRSGVEGDRDWWGDYRAGTVDYATWTTTSAPSSPARSDTPSGQRCWSPSAAGTRTSTRT